MELYIGLMSGTSIDGIDAVLVDFNHLLPKLIATHFTPYDADIRKQILALCQPGENEIQRMGTMDTLLGKAFAQAVNQLLEKAAISPKQIKSIGSHGQTIRHAPHPPSPFTLQIGDPNIIAAQTGIPTVADFRRKDIAFGGQGAPLVPAFHQGVFASSTQDRVIVNIGGIANITILPRNKPEAILGYDTGPGNVLLDAWIHQSLQQTYDKNGQWAAQGYADQELLALLLNEAYFSLPPPKSTGRELFNLTWLAKKLTQAGKNLSAVDVQATLVNLTASSIANAIQNHLGQGEVLVCGGGAHNTLLMSRLQSLMTPTFSVESTERYGVHPDWVEASAFAWFAKQTLEHKTSNLPQVTGAKQAACLGGIYY